MADAKITCRSESEWSRSTTDISTVLQGGQYNNVAGRGCRSMIGRWWSVVASELAREVRNATSFKIANFVEASRAQSCTLVNGAGTRGA